MPPRRPRQQDQPVEFPPLPEGVGPGPRQPIGVPAGFEPGKVEPISWEEIHEDFRVLETSQQFRYFEGDQFLPASWSPEKIWSLQQDLQKAGLLTGSFARGRWDQSTMSSFSYLLGISNVNGNRYSTMLDNMMANPDQWGGEGDVEIDTPPLTTRLTDPDELRAVFRQAVIDLTGEGWSQDQIERAISAYQNTERETQAALHEATYGPDAGGVRSVPPGTTQYGPGGEVVDQISPAAFIEARVREQDPEAIPEHQLLGHAQEALQLLASPAWGVGMGR